jgi:hypothetical protein
LSLLEERCVKNDPIQTALAKLDDPDADLAKGLQSKWALVTAKAARLAGDQDRRDLADKVAASLAALLRAPASSDKGCTAKTAMARALLKLEHDDAELFVAGMRHVQPEPVWGGSEDTAVDFRAACAMGLAGSTYYHKLRELAALMADKEWPARSGAIRAVAVVGGDSAALLLRLKAYIGDKEPEVMADCFTALLAVEGAPSVPLVLSFAPKSEAAILALGASRLTEAVEALGDLFTRTADHEARRTILVSLATSRTEKAIEYLSNLIRTGSVAAATLAVRAVAIHRSDERVRSEIARAVEAREDHALDSVFFTEFRA